MMNMIFERKLAIPMEVKEMYPIGRQTALAVSRRIEEMKRIFAGEEDRLILIIGPCSADHEESVLDYLTRLREVQGEVEDKLFIIPRVYTNKPRTASDGYKGMLHQPDPGAKPDLFKGIISTRELHMRAVSETGFVCADEMLYPENLKYIDDLIGCVTVGARSVENQMHRLTASGMDVPVGMKNPMSGDLCSMLQAIRTAQDAHSFIYRGWAAHSQGNPYAHAVLRGYSDDRGRMLPNYRYDDLCRLAEMYGEAELAHPAVIVDANHANSGKDPFRQPEIVRDVLCSRRKNETLARLVKGFMIESYLEDGAQKIGEGVYGKSITDACLGWEKSKKLIYEIADAL